MRAHRFISIAGATALLVAMTAPVAADGHIEVVADGLEGPRGVDIGADGAIYVAETGTGGDDCPQGESGTCYGPSGAITRVADGVAERVAEGLPSAAAPGETFGVSDLIANDDGTFTVVTNLGMDPSLREGSVYGWLGTVADGVFTATIDVSAIENDLDPDGGPAPDANPHSIAAVEGGVVVADAGGNDVLLAADDGTVSLLGVIAPTMQDIPAELLIGMGVPPEALGLEGAAEDGSEDLSAPVSWPVEAVPTGIVVGPDGAYYVSTLTGAPFPMGGSNVYRLEPGGEPEVYGTGLTSAMDLDFGPDGTLYVAEIVHEGLLPVFMGSAPPIGAVMAIPPGGGEATVLATGEELMALGGLVVDDDGAIYVTTNTIVPGAGQLVKITP